jgi:hypothetical protein
MIIPVSNKFKVFLQSGIVQHAVGIATHGVDFSLLKEMVLKILDNQYNRRRKKILVRT